MKNQQGITVIEFLVSISVLGFIGLIIAFVVIQFTGLHIDTGRGEHTGYITAVERNGLIFKTGKAFVKTDPSSTQEDEYCVIDDAVYDRLAEAARNKEKLTVTHQSYFATGIHECGSEPAVISGVK